MVMRPLHLTHYGVVVSFFVFRKTAVIECEGLGVMMREVLGTAYHRGYLSQVQLHTPAMLPAPSDGPLCVLLPSHHLVTHVTQTTDIAISNETQHNHRPLCQSLCKLHAPHEHPTDDNLMAIHKILMHLLLGIPYGTNGKRNLVGFDNGALLHSSYVGVGSWWGDAWLFYCVNILVDSLVLCGKYRC